MRFRFLVILFIASFLAAAWMAKQRFSVPPTIQVATAEPVKNINPVPAHLDSNVCQNFYKTVCQKRGPSRDPTGVVDADFEGELKALRIYQDIVRAQPQWTLEEVDEELIRRIYTPKARAQITSAYLWVRTKLESWIQEQPETVFSVEDKKRLRARVRATQLELPGPASVYDDERELFTKNDVFYERITDGTLRMRVGGAFLLNVHSWFNLVFTISHEFGHAIDPCEIRATGMSLPSYDQISACFLQTGVVSVRAQREECAQNDQLSETFADWLAVKITARALQQYSAGFKPQQLLNAARNAVRDLCDFDEETGSTESEFHPSPAVRIERIFGNNPEIRELLGCPAAQNYCDFK